MLGDNGMAYHELDLKTNITRHPDGDTLARAIHTLQHIPFGLLEGISASWVLLAHALSSGREDCGALARALLSVHKHQRSSRDGSHDQVLSNSALHAAFERYNTIDRALYTSGVAIWCAEWRSALADPESCVADFAPDVAGAGPGKTGTKERIDVPPICASMAVYDLKFGRVDY